MTGFVWQGRSLPWEELEKRLEGLEESLLEARSLVLSREVLLEAAARLAQELHSGELDAELQATLTGTHWPPEDLRQCLAETAEFLQPENLEAKIDRELGAHDPWIPARVRYDRSVFEACVPLGLLVHIAPSNALSVGFLSLMEGLLAGNLNFVKLGGSDPPVGAVLARRLVEHSQGQLAPFVYVARIASGRRDLLAKILDCADGVAVWGGEETVAAIRDMAPRGARLIEWGHRISFAYLSRSAPLDRQLCDALAREVCLLEQQACSSPQVAYLESEDPLALEAFAQAMAEAMARISPGLARRSPSQHEWADITSVRELARQEQALGLCRVWEAEDRSWRVLLDRRSAMVPSPLYRTLWIKPLPRCQIVSTLRPLHAYLQTVGLACRREELSQLCRLLAAAGATRITPVGAMLHSYPGEPHDGVYALARYTRRVSLQLGEDLQGISNLGVLGGRQSPEPPQGLPVMTRAEFQARPVEDRYAQLYFHSGGSSGAPKLSVFTYADYHYQMARAAEGLYAAGLDPTRDRCMNLFFAGSLYGGFVSFFSVLEHLNAVQFPMAAVSDYQEVARDIVALRVNVLLGMPSYLMELFRSQHEILSAYGGVQKIFYGGEHFSPIQRRFLTEEFGLESIRSATYGTVDAGPLGYQCPHCQGAVHHLHSRLEVLEILKLEEDAPVEAGEVGRMVFTSLHRHGQNLRRYDLGDLGRWVEACPCGRSEPRFELMGRHGDVFRVGTNFFNYRKFVQLLGDELGYAGAVQLEITVQAERERLLLRLEEGWPAAPQARAMLLEHYPSLSESLAVMDFELVPAAPDQFLHAPASGKLREVVDRRSR